MRNTHNTIDPNSKPRPFVHATPLIKVTNEYFYSNEHVF